MSTADMFLKLQGVTGESADSVHKGEIEVVSWSWGIAGQFDGFQAVSKARFRDLQITKRVDRASVTLWNYCRIHKVVDQGLLTVRKAGTTQLEYFTVQMKKVVVRSLDTHTHESEVIENVSLGFASVTVTYTPQGVTGAMGGGAVTFTADVEEG